MLSNCHEAKYAKVNLTMKDRSKEEFECPVAIEFYNKIMGGVALADKMINVYGRSKILQVVEKSIFSPIDEGSGQLMDCVLQTQTSKNLDFIVPLVEALMTPGKLKAQYQRRRGTRRPSKTSRSLLNVGDHLPVTAKTRRRWVNVHNKRRKRTLK
ncbi:rho guanine nucleotide exchange factor 10-like protein [Trichonephila clavata]|uniref:Rho guanine nucleotide exchange factor 10-like protein n=1 Tax=Trichonephila clavata TaxID=2740835 RepID=A0A8X6FNH5_TRICU|nr:rho guanine nucleotide exchange factor 10-like protein [Trichonephila clavata]